MLFMFFKISYVSFNNEFSPVLLEDIKSYCDKTLKKKNNDIPPVWEVIKDAIEQKDLYTFKMLSKQM